MMGSSSINASTLHYHNPTNRSQRQSQTKFPYTIVKSLPIFQTHFSKSLKFSPIQVNNGKSHIPNSIFACSFSPQKEISKFLREKIVLLAVGSFIFMGMGAWPNARPVLAQPLQESGVSEKLEQETETQNVKKEEEEEEEEETQNGKTEAEEEEEEQMYMKLLEGNPRNVDVLKGVFNLKMKRGKTKEAIEYVERLIDIEPAEVEWRLLQALCYEMVGQLSKAKRLFKEILKRRPLLIRALHGLAIVMHKNLEGPAVFEMLNKALEMARREKRVTEERNIRILIGQMHVVKGELQDALEKFQELVKENPRDFRPYLCQGIIYSLLEKKEEAEQQFMTYQNLVPEEYPQRGFLDDVVFEAKTESRQKFKEKVRK